MLTTPFTFHDWSLSTLDNILLGMHRWESYSWLVSMFGRNYIKKKLKENIEESVAKLAKK